MLANMLFPVPSNLSFDSVEFMSFASVIFDEKQNLEIPDATVLIRDRFIHVFALKNDVLDEYEGKKSR